MLLGRVLIERIDQHMGVKKERISAFHATHHAAISHCRVWAAAYFFSLHQKASLDSGHCRFAMNALCC